MIDLNELKILALEDDVHRRDVVKVIDRAIAAESKIEDLERINLELSAITADVQYLQDMLAVCSAERDELKSKLAELESQEPAIEYFMDGGFPNARFNGYQPKSGDKLYLQPIANNSEPVKRITEQDALEIGKSVSEYLNFDSAVWPKIHKMWLGFFGQALLAKLNEHREQEAKPNESVGEVKKVVVNAFSFTAEVKCNCEIKPGAKLYLHPQVTPNKAEVEPKEIKIQVWEHYGCESEKEWNEFQEWLKAGKSTIKPLKDE